MIGSQDNTRHDASPAYLGFIEPRSSYDGLYDPFDPRSNSVLARYSVSLYVYMHGNYIALDVLLKYQRYIMYMYLNFKEKVIQ